ncbi:MAG TPA: tetratricopeptide repeat protein [Chitinophagales bacterium]
MAETQEVQAIQNVVEKIENFIEDNKQAVAIGGGVLVVIVLAFLFVWLKWLPERNLKAAREMYMAEMAFQKDSFNLALNGNGVNKGLLEIQSKYSFTKAANLSNYYIGLCYLNTNKFEDAIKYLDKYSTSDPILGAVKLSAIGDAYSELNKVDDATKYYEKAAEFSDNSQFTPFYILKLGAYFESQKKFKEAVEKYKEVKTKYPSSEEARQADANIARATAQM